jgi:hypothetical protein
MDPNLIIQEQLADPNSITERVMADARRAFSDLPDDALKRVVEGVVTELWSRPIKVTSFIPVLAMRSVRESIEQRDWLSAPVAQTGA